jgi:hypothetical protein
LDGALKEPTRVPGTGHTQTRFSVPWKDSSDSHSQGNINITDGNSNSLVAEYGKMATGSSPGEIRMG